MTGEADEEPQVPLRRWDGTWEDDDPFADLKADVAAYAHADPLATLRSLSEASGVPVGALARYVLARWSAGGAEALMELGTSGVDHLRRVIDEAERAGTEAARRAAYDVVRQQVTWLAHGVDQPAAAFPGGGAGARRRVRLGVYGLIVADERVLLTRLSARVDHAATQGRWTLPGGGLRHGEQPRAGLRRELHEETGLDGEVGELVEVDALRVPPEQTRSGDDVHNVRLLFRVEVDPSRTPEVLEVGGSTAAARWVHRDELPELPMVELARRGARLLGLLGGPARGGVEAANDGRGRTDQ